MSFNRIGIKNGSAFEMEICNCIEIWKNNVFVFDLAELYL